MGSYFRGRTKQHKIIMQYSTHFYCLLFPEFYRSTNTWEWFINISLAHPSYHQSKHSCPLYLSMFYPFLLKRISTQKRRKKYILPKHDLWTREELGPHFWSWFKLSHQFGDLFFNKLLFPCPGLAVSVLHSLVYIALTEMHTHKFHRVEYRKNIFKYMKLIFPQYSALVEVLQHHKSS